MENTYFVVLYFMIGVAFIWISGTKLSLLANEIGDRSKIGKAFIGAFLLALATSLPEIVTTVTASIIDNIPLAVNNLLGGIPLQTCMLAIVDLIIVRKGALTYFSPTTALILNGLFLIVQISLVILASSYGELFSIYGVGAWPILFIIIYFIMLYILKEHESKKKWVPVDLPKATSKKKLPSQKKVAKYSNFKLGSYFLIASIIVLIAGWDVAYSADLLTKQTPISGSFIGATFVALATSLPELTTTFGAIRVGSYTLAFANIFGSNALMVAVFFIADISYRQGSIISQLDHSSLFLAGVGIIVTCVYLWGILERRNKTIFGMGIDSLIVLFVYIISLIFLHQIS